MCDAELLVQGVADV